MGKSIKQTQKEVEANDPPIEINQEWIAYLNKKVSRRLRILAPMPEPTGLAEGKVWIVEEKQGTMRTEVGRIFKCPEFNLRYILKPDRKR